jgi:hypothetical protein
VRPTAEWIARQITKAFAWNFEKAIHCQQAAMKAAEAAGPHYT